LRMVSDCQSKQHDLGTIQDILTVKKLF
jgi:hypothetical protein